MDITPPHAALASAAGFEAFAPALAAARQSLEGLGAAGAFLMLEKAFSDFPVARWIQLEGDEPARVAKTRRYSMAMAIEASDSSEREAAFVLLALREKERGDGAARGIGLWSDPALAALFDGLETRELIAKRRPFFQAFDGFASNAPGLFAPFLARGAKLEPADGASLARQAGLPEIAAMLEQAALEAESPPSPPGPGSPRV